MKSCKIYFSLLSLTLLTACMPDSMTKYKETPVKAVAGSSGSSSTTTTTTTTTGTDISTLGYFQVQDVTAVNPAYYLHKYTASSDATQECQIDNDDLLQDDSTQLSSVDTATNDIACWMETEESKLYFNGAKFRVNVAADTCDYVTVTPYFFWQYKPGTTNKHIIISDCDAVCAIAYPTQCGGQLDYTDAQLSCKYNYSDFGESGPNCDPGTVTTYTYSIHDEDTSSAGCDFTGSTAPTISETDCGGELNNCLAGPGVDFSSASDGWPTTKYYYAVDGLSEDIVIDSPFSKGHSSVRYASNFTNICEDPDNDANVYKYGFTSVTPQSIGLQAYADDNTSTTAITYAGLGEGFAAGDVVGGVLATTAATPLVDDPFKLTNPYYEFTCLNFASEVKGRIRVQIRDWNRIFTRPSGVNTWSTLDEVARANHSKLRKQSSTSTDYEGPGLGYWNDFMDWDTNTRYGAINQPAANSCEVGNVDNIGFAFPGAGL